MGKIDHIEAISNELAAANSILALPRRCNYIRSHNSRCKQCTWVCKHEAIHLSFGKIEISPELCTGCGACTAVCPANALITLNPRQNDIVLAAKKLAKRCGGVACFICEKNAQETNIDTQNVITLPCLDVMDEYLLCGLFACGISHIAIFMPGCQTCPIDGDEPYINTTVHNAKKLLEEWNIEGKIKIFHEIPNNMQNKHKNNHAHSQEENNKRSAFAQTGASVLNYVTDSINKLLATEEEKRAMARKSDRVVVAIDDVDPADTYRSVKLLNLLKYIGTLPEDATIQSRFWNSLHIDEARCHFCGSCATFCPTRALLYQQDDPSDPLSNATLTFNPSLCTACNLCKDSCIRRALLSSTRIPANNLKDGIVLTIFKDKEPFDKNPFMN